MKNFVLDINKKELEKNALDRFYIISGLDSMEEDVKEDMLEIALEVKEKYEEKLSIKSIFSLYSNKSFLDQTYIFDNIKLDCNAFEQIPKEDIVEAYIYIISLESYSNVGDSPFDAFYADTWGTAYIDSARDYLQEYFRNCKSTDLFISNSFGPGYYGMPLTEMSKIFDIVDGSLINTAINENGVIVPGKSCAGIFITLSNKFNIRKNVCESCIGNSIGCTYCTLN